MESISASHQFQSCIAGTSALAAYLAQESEKLKEDEVQTVKEQRAHKEWASKSRKLHAGSNGASYLMLTLRA